MLAEMKLERKLCSGPVTDHPGAGAYGTLAASAPGFRCLDSHQRLPSRTDHNARDMEEFDLQEMKCPTKPCNLCARIRQDAVTTEDRRISIPVNTRAPATRLRAAIDPNAGPYTMSPILRRAIMFRLEA